MSGTLIWRRRSGTRTWCRSICEQWLRQPTQGKCQRGDQLGRAAGIGEQVGDNYELTLITTARNLRPVLLTLS